MRSCGVPANVLPCWPGQYTPEFSGDVHHLEGPLFQPVVECMRALRIRRLRRHRHTTAPTPSPLSALRPVRPTLASIALRSPLSMRGRLDRPQVYDAISGMAPASRCKRSRDALGCGATDSNRVSERTIHAATAVASDRRTGSSALALAAILIGGHLARQLASRVGRRAQL